MQKLKTVVFIGSSKTAPAPWAPGQPGRLGSRVLTYVVKSLASRPVEHEVTVLDPIELKLPVLETPAFFYPSGQMPPEVMYSIIHHLILIFIGLDCGC